jgi:hypothetical protein
VKRLTVKLTYANVMATIAMFLAFGGGAYAATQLPSNSVGTKQLQKEAVTPGKLSADAKDTLTGPTGATGMTGATGDTGPRGLQGLQGDPGRQGDQGKAGDQGIPGEKGEKGAKGDPGEPGEKGAKGDPGEKGEKGAKGDPGEPGEKGANGDPGEKGEKGDPGEPGEPGEKGEKGDQGDPGISNGYFFTSGPAFDEWDGGEQLLATLTLPAGNYIIDSHVLGNNDAGETANISCLVKLGGIIIGETGEASLGGNTNAEDRTVISLSLGGTLATAGTAEFICRAQPGFPGSWLERGMTAIQVSNLTG